MNVISSLKLAGGNIGIEREMLRINQDATLATTMHPETLGKTATHPYITTDFAETLVELVTDIHTSGQEAYEALLTLHRFTQANIGDERLWAPSMPCILPDNLEDIELGYYGDSNSGKIKRLYRQGLSVRYGRAMQMIAGVHFNYSPPEALWAQLAEQDGVGLNQSYINDRYLAMVRNLQRYGWVICYLFGASPAVHTSFTPAHGVLHPLNDTTLGWRHATSLRMSELGYQNKVDFIVSLNDLDSYVRDLITAVTTPAPMYQHYGIKDSNGEYQQISPNILQISNEYYSGARPKRVTKPGELPPTALTKRGIDYVELRLLDVNPFDPCGISLAQIHFLESFMLWAMLTPSPELNHAELNELNSNRLRTACCGNDPSIHLNNHGKPRSIQDWVLDILQDMQPIVAQLDNAKQSTDYQQTLNELEHAVRENTLMHHQIHASMRQQSFIDWGLELTNKHYQSLSQPIDAEKQALLEKQVKASIETYNRLQAQPQEPFEQFLAHYFDQFAPNKSCNMS